MIKKPSRVRPLHRTRVAASFMTLFALSGAVAAAQTSDDQASDGAKDEKRKWEDFDVPVESGGYRSGLRPSAGSRR
jgi:hypothetical protein